MNEPTDKEMIDWLGGKGSKYYGWQVQTPKDPPFVKGCVFLSRNVQPVGSGCYATAREAIAAAMGRKERE
jgi:hypothetical protein